MVDEIDRQIVRDEQFLEAVRSFRYPEGPKPIGECLFCEEPIEETNRRWCDALCRDEWEKRHPT